MTPLLPAHRAADEFARLVDDPTTRATSEYADLVGVVDHLRDHEPPPIRATFVTDLRERLLAAADELLVPVAPVRTLAPARRSGVRHGERHLGAAAAAFVIVAGSVGVAAAAGGAMPGDALYPVKRGLENARVTLTASDAGQGIALVDQAGTRLAEAERLVGDPDATGALEDTLASYRSTATRGADLVFVAYQRDNDPDPVNRLLDLLGGQHSLLESLTERVPPTFTGQVDSALSTLADLVQQARVLCASCGDEPTIASGRELVSAPALESVLVVPAARALAAAQAEETRALAESAEEIADDTPPVSAPTSDPTKPAPPAAPAPTLPQLPIGGAGDEVIDATGGLVSGLTDGVTGLLDEVTNATGGATKPLTDLVNGTLEGLTGLLIGDTGDTGDTTDD